MSAPLPAVPAPVPIEYPGSDGKPMGETLTHGRCIHDVLYFHQNPYPISRCMLRLHTNYSVVPWGRVAFNATQLQHT